MERRYGSLQIMRDVWFKMPFQKEKRRNVVRPKPVKKPEIDRSTEVDDLVHQLGRFMRLRLGIECGFRSNYPPFTPAKYLLFGKALDSVITSQVRLITESADKETIVQVSENLKGLETNLKKLRETTRPRCISKEFTV